MQFWVEAHNIPAVSKQKFMGELERVGLAGNNCRVVRSYELFGAGIAIRGGCHRVVDCDMDEVLGHVARLILRYPRSRINLSFMALQPSLEELEAEEKTDVQ